MHARVNFKEVSEESSAAGATGTSGKQRHLDDAIRSARQALIGQQQADGHWVYELEGDCTIPAEYILMMHFMDEVDVDLERKIAVYLRARQAGHGGWPLYYGGAFDLSCSIKAYYALKIVGDDPQAPHMVRAREAILAHGGAARANVFTRIAMALFEQVPWRAVPYIPLEIMILPKWFPFHLSKVSYWSRTVMVPLFILCTLKPKAKNPRRIDIRELFTIPPEQERRYFQPKTALAWVFWLADRWGRSIDPFIPKSMRQRSMRLAEAWFTARLNGTDGLGGIFPAMVNAYEAMALLGYPANHPQRLLAKAAIKKLLVVEKDWAYCQPCLSPVWDTVIAALAIHEATDEQQAPEAIRGLDWLAARQLSDEPGDWRDYRPNLPGGGWPFQYANHYYPDLDDTGMVGWAMHQIDAPRYRGALERAAEWIAGMQSRNGGFASFDADNTCYYLNAIPFADHGALLDPPTADVTGRCIILLHLVDPARYAESLSRAIDYLKREQEANGSWFGRWGTNYIYGTWSVLTALEIAGEDPRQEYIQLAVNWLKSIQNTDGGWGENNDGYIQAERGQPYASTPYSSAWALLALLAAGEAGSTAVRRGVDYLLTIQADDGLWDHPSFTAPGFPRVLYLKYHGYAKFFPLWALARYRRLAALPIV